MKKGLYKAIRSGVDYTTSVADTRRPVDPLWVLWTHCISHVSIRQADINNTIQITTGVKGRFPEIFYNFWAVWYLGGFLKFAVRVFGGIWYLKQTNTN
jgi:hypothetical protein